MKTFYITYGNNSLLRNCYSIVDAVDYTAAREIVHKVTNGKFAFMYSKEDWYEGGKSQAEKYSLSLVSLQPQSVE